MKKNHYIPHEWNVVCDICSKKIKASDAKQRWDGLIVCPSDFEHRHEQDFVRARTDKITVPFTRPIPPLTFTNVSFTNVSYTIYYVDPDWVVNNYFEEQQWPIL